MQSRIRKLLRSDSDNPAIIKQLQNDFQVYEYLKENKLETTNIEEYAKLFNTLMVDQQQRKSQFNRLHSQYEQMRQRRTQANEQQVEIRINTLDTIQQKVCKQMEISNDLEKEIVETKKSLNLLKGDIGHLVSRNESAKLLSSKIAKVKIVAQDQLKRVTLAYIKDKQQIKLRNQMQKKFSKKLKNVSNYESNSLCRNKKTFADIMLKKQDIYQQLLASKKISDNVEEAEIMKHLNTQKDAQNKQELQILFNLLKVVEKFSIQKINQMQIGPNQLAENIIQYYQNLQEISLSSENIIENGKLAVSKILLQYSRAQESIRNLSQSYQQLLNIKKDNKQKLIEYERQQSQLLRKFNIELQDKYKIDKNQQRNYQAKLKQFANILSTLFVMLSYLQKNIHFPISYQFQYHPFTFSNLSENQKVKDRIKYNYISCLSKVYRLLQCPIINSQLNFCPIKHKQQMEQFYLSLHNSLKKWFQDIKNKCSPNYLQNKLQKKMRIPVSRHSVLASDSRRNHHYKKQSQNIHQEDDEEPHQLYQDQQILQEPLMSSKPISSQQLPQSPKQSIKAKRIKLLQGIDTDYYKMIKSTIKMQKENTRKNYQFLRSFKRAKYASRDNILEQKRFEASFSVLFMKQSTPNLNKSSKLQSSTNLNVKSFNQSTKSRSFFRKWTQANTPTGISTPLHDQKAFFKSSLDSSALKKLRIAQKLKIALKFI